MGTAFGVAGCNLWGTEFEKPRCSIEMHSKRRVSERLEGLKSARYKSSWTHLDAKPSVHEPLARLANIGNDRIVEEMGRTATQSATAVEKTLSDA